MFTCEFCHKKFSRKDALKRHGDCRKTDPQTCKDCGNVYTSEGSLQRHYREKHLKRKKEASPTRTAKKQMSEPSTSSVISSQEDVSDKRETNCVNPTESIQSVNSAFERQIATYRFSLNEKITNVEECMDYCEEEIIKLLENNLLRLRTIKVSVILSSRFLLQSKEQIEEHSFKTEYFLVTMGTCLEEKYNDFRSEIDLRYSKFVTQGSGWTLHEHLHVEVQVAKWNPLKGSSYMELPKKIRNKKAVLNIENSDTKCFVWSVLAYLHPIGSKQHPSRVTHYKPHEKELNLTGMTFPIKLSDISKFERLNDISVNVFSWDNVDGITGPLYFRSSSKSKHVNLLLIENEDGNSHYCLIRNLSRLISSRLSQHHGRKHLCDGCLSYFPSGEKLEDHQTRDCGHVKIELPNTKWRKNKYGEIRPNNIIKFTNFEKKLKVPFVVYADFETILEPIIKDESKSYPKSVYTHHHIPYSFSYYIKCEFDDSHSKFHEPYRGEDAVIKFIRDLEIDCLSIYDKFLKIEKKMSPLTLKQQTEFDQAEMCHICEKRFVPNDEKKIVKDHCHLTGNFRGAAHESCNLHFQVAKFIPVYFHNLSNFDSHLFIKYLASEGETLDVIPYNSEKYISFTKHVVDGEKKETGLKLRFLDSFRFMATSLDKLSQNLNPEQCRIVKKYFHDEDKFKLMRLKGVFPYSYLDSFSKLEERELPPMVEFYNKLRNENIQEEDYERAQKVWELFNCNTLGEYSDIYLTSDVLILADIFENFRDTCLATYGLDPCQYYTASGLSFDAALKVTSIELELLTDEDMLYFVKHGIRGGVSQCSVRRAFANNTFLPDYDATKPTSYIMYLDATNLYGAAMSQYLPDGKFKWLSKQDIKNLDYMNIDEESNTGYILEVDLKYPENLHDLHNELPFCPESIVPKGSTAKIPKLIPNLNKKEKYVIHIKNLRQALDHGLELVQIHRVLSFHQSPWLKPYIDLNTVKRTEAKNKFEKDFFKLMNNSVFGKTMENVEKRVNFKLITHWKNKGKKRGAEAWITKPSLKNVIYFHENLVGIEMRKNKIMYNKPIYLGFTILDISKTIIYEFLYKYIKSKYENKATLLYTDTDSLILRVETENFYDDMKENLDKFDTSNYKQDNPHHVPINKSILGKMKDEYAGKIIWSFIGTGAKAYCVNVEGELTKKAKGVADYVTRNELSFDDYQNVLTSESSISRSMNTFRSYEHEMYVQMQEKVVLSYMDDKRFLISDSEKTLAWGHKDIPSIEIAEQC